MSVTLSEITTASTHLSGNPIWVKATTSAIPSGASDYKILLKITNPDNDLYGAPFIDAVAPDSDGVAWFDFSGYVDQAKAKKIRWPIPTLYEGKTTAYSDQVFDIWLYPGERYVDSDGDLQESYGEPLQPVFVVKGKLQTAAVAELNDASSSWFDYFCTGGHWLSYLPSTQIVAPYQPVKLWWKSPETKAYDIRIKGYYSDGTTATTSLTPSLYADVIYEFDVSPAINNIPVTATGKKLLYYEVWGNPSSIEKRTFRIDWTYHESYWYLFADNQAGGIDCIWLQGRVQYAPEGEKIVTGRPLARDEGATTHTRIVSGNIRRRKWIANSGMKSKAEMQALDMLLNAPAAWIAIPPASGSTDIAAYTICPVIIDSTSLQLTDEINDLESVDIELTEAH